MNIFLGVDGGGSKTRFLLIDAAGRVLAAHTEGPAYYLEIGLDGLRAMLARGTGTTLRLAGIPASAVTFAFFGIPAYGEDRSVLPMLDAAPAAVLPAARYRCGNDMVCGWAGALAGAEGVNVVAGTGSIAYGEYAGRSARAGGWGELFSDEGSAYWLAREGLRLFSRMSDGRTPRGALHGLVRKHFALEEDLDLCAAVYGKSVEQRSQFAQLSRLVAAAARAGDSAAQTLFTQAAQELADLVSAIRTQLAVAEGTELAVSCSGGLFEADGLLRPLFEATLLRAGPKYRFVTARLPPHAGAALYAARLAGVAPDEALLSQLAACV